MGQCRDAVAFLFRQTQEFSPNLMKSPWAQDHLLDNKRIWTLCCPYMKAITYTAAREGLASTMDKVCRDRSPIIITRNRDQSVVMLSLADYEQLEETAYLLRSPANARRLLSAIGSLEKGKGRERKIPLES
jgi:antitoxin YefM